MRAEIKEKLATSNTAEVKGKAAPSNPGEIVENGATSDPSEIIAKAAISKPKDRNPRRAWSGNFLFTELPHSNSAQKYATRYDRRKETLNSDGKMIPLPHTDIGCFSMLYKNKEGCLKVRSKERQWVDVKILPHLFINKDDCLKCTQLSGVSVINSTCFLCNALYDLRFLESIKIAQH